MSNEMTLIQYALIVCVIISICFLSKLLLDVAKEIDEFVIGE